MIRVRRGWQQTALPRQSITVVWPTNYSQLVWPSVTTWADCYFHSKFQSKTRLEKNNNVILGVQSRFLCAFKHVSGRSIILFYRIARRKQLHANQDPQEPALTKSKKKKTIFRQWSVWNVHEIKRWRKYGIKWSRLPENVVVWMCLALYPKFNESRRLSSATCSPVHAVGFRETLYRLGEPHAQAQRFKVGVDRDS